MEEIKSGLNMEQLHYLESAIARELEDQQFSSANLCVVKDGGVQYRLSLGMADKSRNIENENDTIYRLYSLSKPITAVAAMVLYERGALDLLAPVSDYIPAFRDVKIYSQSGMMEPKRPMLVKDLLSMTSGLIYPAKDPAGILIEMLYNRVQADIGAGKEVTTLGFCNLLAERPLAFHPGESFRYGASIDVLGGVVEVASGKKLGEFMQEAIFTPLGMVDTDFHVPRAKHNRLAELYKRVDDGGKFVLKPEIERNSGLTKGLTPPALELGGMGLFSTINDYTSFIMMLAGQGANGARVLGRQSVALLTSNALSEDIRNASELNKLANCVGCGYGGGMRILLDQTEAMSNASVGEFGWDGETGSYFSVDPKNNVGFVFLTQTLPYNKPELYRKIRSIVYSSL